MTISFLRPVGALADVRELEYVSALHQTDMPDLRTDGSIKDVDILRFLSSRYGIRVTPSEVRNTIMHGLGGGEDEEECIDLMEMVAILLIPILIKAAGQVTADEEDTLTREDFVDEHEYGRYQRRKALAESLQPHKSLMKYVLNMILHDVTGSETPKELDRELVRKIFVSYGETELAKNDSLLDEMVAAAQGRACSRNEEDGDGDTVEESKDEGGQDSMVLDRDTFARALTGDVLLYDVDNEMRYTTNYYDVFKTHRSSHKVVQPTDVEQGSKVGLVSEAQKEEMRPVRKIWTASAIDFAAGTYRSKVLVVSLWATFVITYFAYWHSETWEKIDSGCVEYSKSRGEAFGCRVAESVVRWFVVFFFACLLGLAFVGLGSIGNNIESENKCVPWVGLVTVLGLAIGPYIEDRFSNDPEDVLLYHASLALGCWVMSLHFSDFVGRCIPRGLLETKPRLERLFIPGGIRSESLSKQAAAHKMNSMAKHALDIVTINEEDSLVRTHYGQALLAFSKLDEKFEPAGGFAWTWKRIFNKDLFRKEGIWIPARFIAGNVAMVIVSVFVLLSGINLTQTAVNEYGKNNTEDMFEVVFNDAFGDHTVSDEIVAKALSYQDFSQLAYEDNNYSCITLAPQFSNITKVACRDAEGSLSCEHTNSSSICTLLQENVRSTADSFEHAVRYAADAAVKETMNSFYPEERYMVVAPLVVGTCIAFLACVILTVIYLPSVTSTIMKLRHGVIPTFRDQNFGKHRFGAELVTILLGSMIWGTLLSSVIVGGLVGGIVFVLLWQVTEQFTLRFLAFLVGVTVVIIFRVLLLLVVRTKFYDAFYRARPARTNIVALTLEASNFVLSFGFIIVRVVRLLLTSALYIGRIDTPFLAPGVGNLWGYFELDVYPTIFLKDMLAHDAHRHPYLELLGKMYMLKLRYGENFGKTAGSCWRLIFVYALMPWLSKYRIMTRPGMHDEDDINVKSDRSSIDFISLNKTVSKARLSETIMSTRTLEGHSLATTAGQEESVKADVGCAGAEMAEHEMPTFASADEKVLWLEENNAVLELEVAELKRKLLLTEMKLHRRSSLQQLKM